MRFPAGMLVVLCLLLFGADGGRTQDPQGVDVQVVKYDGLKEAVLKNRGKVVVVDFWATWCVPCVKNFPHVVEMQKKYAKDGLVVISVSIDELGDNTPEQRKDKVLKRLQALQAKGTKNLILDESSELLKKKLRIESIPSVYVFNRQGQWIQFTSEEASPKAVEDLALKWLREK